MSHNISWLIRLRMRTQMTILMHEMQIDFLLKFFNDNKQKRKSGKNLVTISSPYWINVTTYLFHLIKQNLCKKLAWLTFCYLLIFFKSTNYNKRHTNQANLVNEGVYGYPFHVIRKLSNSFLRY